MHHMTAPDETKKAAELLGGERFAMLTTTDAAGKLFSRPMGEGHRRPCSGGDNEKVAL